VSDEEPLRRRLEFVGRTVPQVGTWRAVLPFSISLLSDVSGIRGRAWSASQQTTCQWKEARGMGDLDLKGVLNPNSFSSRRVVLRAAKMKQSKED
jgi:hypothetical protein